MVKRQGGIRRKTRRLLRKPLRARGKLQLTRFLATFELGDKVVIMQEPSVQKGQFHMRHYGKNGVITERRGNSYAVTFFDGGKKKVILTHPVHLKRIA